MALDSSDTWHPLRALLQFQLASDAQAVFHLPFVLDALSPECFEPSPHRQKWTARITSLLNSKDPGARWAGLSIALRTATHSKAVMIECAQAWMGAAQSIIARNEPAPITKASIRLLRHVCESATDIPEFQRQVVTPSIPKISAALATIVEQSFDEELKITAFSTLAQLVVLHPTLHRSMYNSLSALCLRYLDGAAANTSAALLQAASRLYSLLHHTGGKVGAAQLWGKAMDETIAFTAGAYIALRTSAPPDPSMQYPALQGPSDPLLAVRLNLDRLRCGVQALSDLLQTSTHRSVQVPIGALVRLCSAFLRSSDDKREGHIDPAVRASEVAAIPTLLRMGCELLESVSRCVRHHLTAHTPRMLSYLAYHLERTLTSAERLPFLRATNTLLRNSLSPNSALIANRLAKALLRCLSPLLARQEASASSTGTTDAVGKKGKKRARGYEGDEVFRVGQKVIFESDVDADVVLAAIDGLRLVTRDSQLGAAIRSLVSRVFLSTLLELQQLAPASVSDNRAMHGKLLAEVQDLCTELGIATSSSMSKSLPLVIRALENTGLDDDSSVRHRLDLLIHPRLPPLLRSFPQVEHLALFRAEGQEERALRASMGFASAASDPEVSILHQDPAPAPNQEDAIMSTATGNAMVSVARENPTGSSTVPPMPPSKEPPHVAPTQPAMTVARTTFEAGSQNLHSSGPSVAPPASSGIHDSSSGPSGHNDPARAPQIRPAVAIAGPSEATRDPAQASAELVKMVVGGASDDEDEDEEMPGIDAGSDSD